jgi:hypothetical protein
MGKQVQGGDAMTKITIEGGQLIVEVEGFDKVLAVKSRISVDLAHVSGARIDADAAHEWQGVRFPGARIPGVVTAGTFYRGGEKVFWDVHGGGDNAVVIDLVHDEYDRLVVEVDDPAEAVAAINAAV